MRASSLPILSTMPLQATLLEGISINWYFIELLPELITKIFMLNFYTRKLRLLRLYRRNHDRIKNIIYRTATAKVIYRFVQTLEHWANRQCTGFPLNGFIGVIAGI